MTIARCLTTLFLLVLSGFSGPGRAAESVANSAVLVRSPEPGWPQWRGPRRDAVCDETGLRQSWPEAGPPVLWSITGIGFGYSAPIISRGRLYITGDQADALHLFAFDLQANPIWQTANGRDWKKPYPGGRACPVYADGRLFHLNAHGRLICLDAATGETLWVVDVQERFDAKNLTWAKSECLVVDEGRVVVTPGGNKALMAALNVATGDTVWTTPPLELGVSKDARFQTLNSPSGNIDPSSYASPVLFRFAGRRILANCSLRHFFGVDARSGELLWVRPLKTRYDVIAATPVLSGNRIFATAPDTEDGWCYEMVVGKPTPELRALWHDALDTCHGGLVSVDGSIFGTRYRSKKGWVNLDAETGAVRYELADLAMGSMLYADGQLYGLTQAGEMLLLEPGSEAFQINGRFTFQRDHRRDVWAHPVIHQRRLYLRYHDRLTCYDIAVR